MIRFCPGGGAAAYLAAAILAGGCVTVPGDASLSISNVTQGLARVESQDKGMIYVEGTTFRVARNGECLAIGKTVPCMRFAIAFDYEAQSESTTLMCSSEFDKPTEVVDRFRTHGKGREFSAPIVLKGKSGKAFWPGYVTIDDDEVPDRLTTVCSFEGNEVLRVTFKFQ